MFEFIVGGGTGAFPLQRNMPFADFVKIFSSVMAKAWLAYLVQWILRFEVPKYMTLAFYQMAIHSRQKNTKV